MSESVPLPATGAPGLTGPTSPLVSPDFSGTDVSEVPAHIQRIVSEGPRPEVMPKTPTAMHPRAHLPKYKGHVPGVLPNNHPEVIRRTRALQSQRRREEVRRQQAMAAEAAVPQHLAPAQYAEDMVEIVGSAKVDVHDPDEGHIKTDHHGAMGRIFSSYVDREGVRRHILKTEDNALRGVRECDLKLRSPRVAMTRPLSAAERAARADRIARDPDGAERQIFGGRTAAEVAALLCGESVSEPNPR